MPPGFLILGAQKAGTTALFRYLTGCEGFVPPERFELHFFDNEFWRGWAWYLSHFPMGRKTEAGSALITGEKTPYYLYHPHVPVRVRSTLSGARFIIMLRDPVDRAYSHFQHSREQGFETCESFEEALAREDDRLAGEEARLVDPGYRSFSHQHYSYRHRSRYAVQIERWFRFFPSERFLILQSEALFTDPDPVTERVRSFLGLTGTVRGKFRPRNVGGYRRLDPAVRDRLRPLFADDEERLFQLIGKRLDWK